MINIVNNENFNPKDIPRNIQTLKEQRKNLPLYKIQKNSVKIIKEKTASNSTSTKYAYTISIFDHIRSILNNPKIIPWLYFGPGVEDEIKSELWNGSVWQESPLFGEININYRNGKVIVIREL